MSLNVSEAKAAQIAIVNQSTCERVFELSSMMYNVSKLFERYITCVEGEILTHSTIQEGLDIARDYVETQRYLFRGMPKPDGLEMALGEMVAKIRVTCNVLSENSRQFSMTYASFHRKHYESGKEDEEVDEASSDHDDLAKKFKKNVGELLEPLGKVIDEIHEQAKCTALSRQGLYKLFDGIEFKNIDRSFQKFGDRRKEPLLSYQGTIGLLSSSRDGIPSAVAVTTADTPAVISTPPASPKQTKSKPAAVKLPKAALPLQQTASSNKTKPRPADAVSTPPSSPKRAEPKPASVAVSPPPEPPKISIPDQELFFDLSSLSAFKRGMRFAFPSP